MELRATSSSRTDDVDLRNFDADTGSIADHGPLTVERHFLLDHFRRLFWTGRLYVDPKPEKPNPNGYRAQQGLYPILEPFDLKGVGALGNRYIDLREAGRHLALPARRSAACAGSRRRSAPTRSSGRTPTSTATTATPARSPGWTGSSSARRRSSAPSTPSTIPVKWDEKVDWAFDDKWEKRKVYVIEGISKLPQYAYGEARHLHRQGDVGDPVHRHLRPLGRALEDLDQRHVSFRKKAFDGAGAIKYADEMGFMPGDRHGRHAARARHQGVAARARASRASRAGTSTRARRPAITDDWFTVAALVNAGH